MCLKQTPAEPAILQSKRISLLGEPPSLDFSRRFTIQIYCGKINLGKSFGSSGGLCLQHSTSTSWNTRLKEAYMIVEIIVAVVTCATSIINTIFVALSYLKGKDKE